MRAWCLAATIAGLASPASAQDRRCAGNDPVAAERERLRARESLERALRRPRYVDPEALQSAIAAATASCAAGEDRGLALRAAALRARADHVDAARDLDAYLARHPIASHPERELQDFLRELSAALDSSVARVHVRCDALPQARVVVDDVPLDETASSIAVAPGSVRVAAQARGYEDAVVTVTATVRETTTLTVRADGERVATTDLVLRRIAVAPPPAPIAPSHPLRPWAISASAATGVLLAVGAGFAVWRESAATSYRAPGCESMAPPSAASVSAYGNFQDANAATLGAFVTAGVFAVGAGVLWYLDLRRPRAHALACAPGPGGFGCALRF
jgi:hypothetical protein